MISGEFGYTLAFITGLMGASHCLGMCGGLAAGYFAGHGWRHKLLPQFGYHSIQPALTSDRDNRYRHQRHDHDAGLECVAEAYSQEPTYGGVSEHDQRGQQNTRRRTQTEACGKGLAASDKLRRDVADHEDQDHHHEN